MCIWGCGLPAHCSQLADAAGFIYADLKDELNTHLAPQALFTWSSPGCSHNCFKLSPFQAHWGRWLYTHFLRPACSFAVHVGSGPSPISCGVFLQLPVLQAFPLLVAGHVLLLLPSLASLFVYSQLAYLQFTWEVGLPPSPVEFSSQENLFIYSSVMDFPSSPLRHSGHPALFATCLFCCCCLLFSFFLLSLGGGQSVQGAMLIWPRVVCGSTMFHLAHLVVCIFPSDLGTGIWQGGSPPSFSV
jgi:hypothetical protein